MEDILISVFSKIENQYLVAFIFVSLFLFFILKKEIQDKFKELFLKKKEEVVLPKISDLDSHDIFSTFRRVTAEVGNMKFYTDQEYDSSKTRMCYDFTVQKSRFCELHMKEIIETKGLSEMNTDQLKQFVLSKQMQMHQDYVKEIKGIWLGKGISVEDVDYVIALFEKFRFDVIRSFEHRIAAIFGSSFHPNNFERMLAIFDMWAMGIDLLPKDMNTTFEYLNGKFKDIDY
tara:strand:- start:28240 stop:28932 length:693 start_codon:yes stop_codon:yes gene_type:complete